jgi:hypothetical protein
VFGQSVTFTAAVTANAPGAGTPTGTVTFKDGSNTLGTRTLTGGVATFSTSALAVAGHSITAVYGGDGNFTGSTSASATQTVNQDGTGTALAESPNPSVFGQSVTFTATVSASAPGAGTPTGTVMFKDGTAVIDTGTLSGGVATFTTSALAAASHTITAVYGGDGDFTGSTSPSATQTVNKDGTGTALAESPNPSMFGQSVTFTATVSASAPGAGTPTGTVMFKDGTAVIDTGTLSGGVATFTTSALAVASHTITVVYGGDGNFAGSTSPSATQTVNKDGTGTALAESPNPSVFGQSVTFTATVSASAPGAGTPTGTVMFKDGTAVIDTGTLSGGVATFTTSALAVASHTITVVYGGDGNFAGSTSPSATQTVNKGGTNTSVISSLNPSASGQSVTFTATVSASAPGSGTPTGTVTFKDGTTVVGTGTLSGGTATYSTSALSIGSHSITASYGGNGSFTGGTSASLSQSVRSFASTSTVISSVNPSVFGQSVTFTATVKASSGTATPTGTVTFLDGGMAIGTGSLSGGKATFSTSTLAVASHSITVSYGGDGNFTGSTSPALNQVVNKDPSKTTLNLSLNTSVYGQAVTFTATVAALPPGAGTPSGTVTFLDGTTPLYTANLSGGTATYSTTTLAVGSHSIVASYNGDGNFAVSASTGKAFVVSQDGTTTVVKSSLNPSGAGQSVTFTATVTANTPGGGIPGGTVTFKDGATTLGTGTLNATGQATYTTSTLSAGSHAITASYAATTDYLGSTSTALTQTVKAAAAAVAGSAPTSSTRGTNAGTFAAVASASSAAAPSGSGTASVAPGGSTTGPVNASVSSLSVVNSTQPTTTGQPAGVASSEPEGATFESDSTRIAILDRIFAAFGATSLADEDAEAEGDLG